MSSRPIVKRLANGVPVIQVPQKGATSMTLLVLCKVGSRYETKEINGASHFIEHLMFKGTKRRPSTEKISQELDRFGAEYNAYTDKDATGYYVKMDASHTDLAIDILHDMLFQSLYDAAEIDRERGVIVEEINMYEDNPRMHIDELLEAAMYPGSTLGWNIAGPREIIKSVTRDQLIAYRDAYYIPERLSIVLAGKIEKTAMAKLEKTFGKVKRPSGRDVPFAPFVAPEKLPDPVAFQKKQTEQVQVGLAFRGLPQGHADIPAAALLATILGGSMSSRLFIQIRERRGLCYSIHASHGAREDIGEFTVMAGLDKSRMEEAMKAIFHELKAIAKDGVTAAELRLAKDHVRGKTMLAFEDSATQAEWYGRQWVFQKKLETPEQKMARYEAVTRAKVAEVAKRILRPETMAFAVIGPFESKAHVQRLGSW